MNEDQRENKKLSNELGECIFDATVSFFERKKMTNYCDCSVIAIPALIEAVISFMRILSGQSRTRVMSDLIKIISDDDIINFGEKDFQ